MAGDRKRDILGVLVDEVDYEEAVDRVLTAARSCQRFSCTALPVHGVMTGVLDPEHRYRLNSLDMVTPDGQPVRWSLNWIYRSRLVDRVYGPNLMREICLRASEEGLPIYLYGAGPEVVFRLNDALRDEFPALHIAGAEPGLYRQVSELEGSATVRRIRDSGAALTFVGLGCPRQEIFVYEYATALSMPVIAVGAAFDYLAGVRSEPSQRVQRLGLQWAYRLAQNPRRLWKRYLVFNALFAFLLLLQGLGIWKPRVDSSRPPVQSLRPG